MALTALALGSLAGLWPWGRAQNALPDALPIDRAWIVAAALLLSVGVAATLTVTVSSDNGVGALNVGLWLLWPGAVSVLYVAGVQALGAGPRGGEGTTMAGWVAVSVATLLLAVSLHHAYSWTYEDGRPAEADHALRPSEAGRHLLVPRARQRHRDGDGGRRGAGGTWRLPAGLRQRPGTSSI